MRTKAALAFVFALAAQAQTARPSFEVASVKLNTENGQIDCTPRRSGARVIMHNTQLACVANYAYGLTNSAYELVGSLRLPDGWNWYDFETLAPAGARDDDLRLMFQSLLEERFQLRVHREMRELTGFDLVTARGGAKIKAARADSVMAVDGRPIREGPGGIALGEDGRHLIGKGSSIAQLIASLVRELRVPITDRTGLTGKFDYNVVYSPDDATFAPTLEVAMLDELGLRLEKAKMQVNVLVVDHIEKPSPN